MEPVAVCPNLPKSTMIEKALLSGLWARPVGCYCPFIILTLAHVSPFVSPVFSPLSLRHGVAVVCFEVTIWVVMPWRPVPCDLGDPGWRDPWFPHGAFVASLTLWYGLVVWMFFPLFLLPYHDEMIQCYLFCGRRPLPFGGSHLRLPSGPAGIRTTTGSLSALARPTPYQLSHRVAWDDTMLSPLALINPWTGTCHVVVWLVCFVFLFLCFWFFLFLLLVCVSVRLWRLRDSPLDCVQVLHQFTLEARQSADGQLCALINQLTLFCNMQLNVLNDLAEAMKALDGKKIAVLVAGCS